MVKTMLDIPEKTSKFLDFVKEEHGFKDTSQTIAFVVDEYERMLEPEVRPEYIEKAKKIEKGKFTQYSSIEALRKEIENT